MDNSVKNNDWQLRTMDIREKCKYLLASEKLTDCQFVVGTKCEVLKAHKLILAIASPVFETMFYGAMAESDVSITDIQPSVFKALLQYIYCVDFKTTDVDMAFDLCYAAKKYMLLGLVQKCCNDIKTLLNPANVCKSHEFAMFIDEPSLIAFTTKMISEKTMEILAHPCINDFSLHTWLTILDFDQLNIESECDLLTPLLGWAKKECQRGDKAETVENVRNAIGPALEKIRFLSLTPKQFAQGPFKSNLLLPMESLAIMANLADSNSHPMPTGFSTVAKKRLRDKHLSLFNVLTVRVAGFAQNMKYDAAKSRNFTFTVDRKVLFYGVQIKLPSPLPIDGSFAKGRLGVKNAVDDPVTLLAKDTKMISNFITLGCESPVTIEPLKEYCIDLTFMKRFEAKCYNCRSKVSCEGVNFTTISNNISHGYMVIYSYTVIHSILFSVVCEEVKIAKSMLEVR